MLTPGMPDPHGSSHLWTNEPDRSNQIRIFSTETLPWSSNPCVHWIMVVLLVWPTWERQCSIPGSLERKEKENIRRESSQKNMEILIYHILLQFPRHSPMHCAPLCGGFCTHYLPAPLKPGKACSSCHDQLKYPFLTEALPDTLKVFLPSLIPACIVGSFSPLTPICPCFSLSHVHFWQPGYVLLRAHCNTRYLSHWVLSTWQEQWIHSYTPCFSWSHFSRDALRFFTIY